MKTVYKSTAHLMNMQTRRQGLWLEERPLRRRLPKLKGGGKSRSHSGEQGRGGQIFGAGETVKQTGIYEVVHDGEHRSAHEVVMLRDDAFPPCDTCNARVRFRLIRTAPYIFQDEDFEEPE